MGGDGMRALVDGRGLTLRSILTFATALKKDPIEEKRERPMMPKDTEAEVRQHNYVDTYVDQIHVHPSRERPCLGVRGCGFRIGRPCGSALLLPLPLLTLSALYLHSWLTTPSFDLMLQLDAILSRVSDLVTPYRYTYEELLYKKRPASGHHGPDKPKKGQLRSVLQVCAKTSQRPLHFAWMNID